MKKLSHTNLKLSKKKWIIFGVGTIGRIIHQELIKNNQKIECFVDSDKKKQNSDVDGVRIISPEDFLKIYNKDHPLIIGHNYFAHTVPLLEKHGYLNFYHAIEIIEKCKFYDHYLKMDKMFFLGELHPLKVERLVKFYCEMGRKNDYAQEEIINLKSLDVQITEKCSLKCKDCSNLMQYYQKPVDAEQSLLFDSMDRLMSIIDNVNELRILGGDPFMNKEIHKYIEKLLQYKNFGKIIIYTNARFVPKGKNIECLKNDRVALDITNYGDPSKAHDDLVKIAEKEGIQYSSFRCTTWQDCGRIVKDNNKTEQRLVEQFNNCCNSDLITLLHGKLYRCPFSANLHNLKFYELDSIDEINILDQNINDNELKTKIKELCFDKKYLSACKNCNGRDFNSIDIPSAIQTRKFITP